MHRLNKKALKHGMIYIFIGVATILVFNFIQNEQLKAQKNEQLKAQKQEIADSTKLALSSMISSYKDGEISIIEISKITPFNWDRLFVFGPYTNPKNIDKVVGKAWRDTCTTSIESSDGIALLVFTINGQAIQCIEYGRDNGDFDSLEGYRGGMLAANAVFVLDDMGTVILANGK